MLTPISEFASLLSRSPLLIPPLIGCAVAVLIAIGVAVARARGGEDLLAKRARSGWVLASFGLFGVSVAIPFGALTQGNVFLYPHGTLLVPTAFLAIGILGQRRPYSVLWLRRFHDQVQRRAPLLGATRGLAVLTTLRDSQVKSSFGQALSESLGLWLSVIAVSTFTTFGLVYAAAWIALNMLPHITFAIATLILSLLFLAAYFTVVVLSLRRRGRERLKPERRREQLRDFFTAVEDNRVHPQLKIFQTDDAAWQDDVRVCLQRCDAVLVDLSELSENVEWEIREAYALRPAEDIILCANRPDADGVLPKAIADQLSNLLPGAAFRRSRYFAYSADWTGRVGAAQKESRLAASRLIAAAMVAAKARRAAAVRIDHKEAFARAFSQRRA